MLRVPIGDDTFSYRRRLPHLEKREKWYFVTWCTRDRLILPPKARDIALECCIHDHLQSYWLDVAVVMPDHLHLIVAPYDEQLLATVLKRIKRVSAHLITRESAKRRHIWQREWFDRI